MFSSQHGRRGRFVGFGLLACLLTLGSLWPTLASAQHTSTECPAQTGTVSSGGTVTLNITDCASNIGFAGIGDVDGGSLGPADFEDHGTATTRITGGQWFLDYSHNGTTGIGSSDVFEITEATATGNGDVRVTISITPSASPITVLPATLPTLTAGTPFSQTLTSSGGLAPYTYSLQAGALPIGVTLSSAGVLSGTPTQRGAYSFSVRSTDSTTPTAQFVDKGYTGTVQNPSLALVAATGTAIQGVPFSQTLATVGGVAPHTYLLETGTLPAGISISSAGVVSGTTAAAPGNYPVTIRVTDASTGPGTYFEVENFTLVLSPPPSVSIAVAPVSVNENSGTNLVYTVTRSLNLSSPTTVNITTTGTAASGTDYTGGVATVVIPAGATTATITIVPTGDTTVEANETVILTVAAGTGYTVGAPASATGTILNDDFPSASIAVAPVSVLEDGASNLVYTVTLNQAALTPTSVNFTVAGTATNGTDYATVTSPLLIPAGNTTGTITVDPTADATIESNETVIITLAVGTGYTVGSPASIIGTITNDDLPNLTINNVTVNEGNAGLTNFTFTVSVSAPAGPGGVTFDIGTANGTATAGVDYVASSLTGQTIPAGSSTYSFIVQVVGDTLNEADDTFFVNVSNVTGAVVVDGQGVGTITNDDPLPSLSINDVNVVEGNSGTANAVFTVTLSAASGQNVTVNYATADGTATQPADYTTTSGTLTFTPSQTTQTITVPVVGETVPEANETFFVNLSGATNATISDNQGVGTITNDDVPVTVSPGVLPNGTVAAAYSQTISASGGVAPYTFVVTAGALPAGLFLNASNGLLSGTPTAGGSFNFTVTATDSSPFPGPFSGSQAYTLVINAPTIVLPPTPLAGGTIGAAYSAAITPASGGTSPYAYAVTAGALPGGLTLNTTTGDITGTPTVDGTFNFSITATDSSTGTGPYTATQAYSIVVVAVPPVANAVSITVAYNAAATNVPLNITGGAATSVAIGTPATNGTAIATGTSITYQPNAGFAGSDSFTYTATNSGGTSAPATVTVTVQDPVFSITPSGGFAATVAAPYTQTFTFNGGAQPWSGFQVTTLPAGVTITGTTANTVTISGTPTQAGSFNLNVSATDSSTGNGPYTVGQAFTLTVAAPTLTLTPAATTFAAPYGAAYSQSFTASGGIGPYTYAQTGTLPPGVSFAGNTVSGTPTTPGSFSFTITATDTGSTGTGSPFTVAQNYTITVASPTILVNPATLPNPTAGTAYSQTLTATGGVGPYGFALSAGSLPSGLILNTGGVLSGTSFEVGAFNFTVTATDANGQTGARAYTVTIAAPVLTMTPAAGTLNAPYAAPFAQTFTAAGAPGPYIYTLSGALPTGIAFSALTGALSGTPTVPGSYPITVTATNTVLTGAGAPFSIAQNYTLDVPAPTIVVNPATLPDPAAGTAYSQTLAVSGGVAPYSTTVTSGTLPSGITLTTGGVLSGTSNEVGTYNITVTATDANSQTGTRAYTLTIAAPTLTMTPAAGTLTATYAVPYSQTFTASGSPGPYNYVLTGALPAGVSFSGGVLSGTPTVPGSYPITVTATDTVLTGAGAPFSIAQNYTLDVPVPVIVIAPATLPNTTAGLAYTQSITVSGGAAPYTFAVTAGALPNGLTLGSGGALAGTTTASGTFNFSVTATDANGQTASRAYTVIVAIPTVTLTPATLPGGTAGTPYTQALTIAGGIAPYTVTQTGALPTGLTFNAATRTFSGTPTQAGTFNISVTVTDSTGGTAATVTNAYTLTIATPTLALTPATVPAGSAGVAYSQTFVASGGIAPYAYTLSAGALPAGLTLNATTGALSGTPTVAGTFNFSVTATDSTTGTAATVTNAYTLTLSAPTIVINPPTLAGNGIVAVPYNRVLTAIGGTAPYTFAITAGALPAGVTLSTAGTLSGTPTVAGVFNFTVRATDALAFTGTRVYAVTVVNRPDPSRDPEVRGLLEAQADATRRFATSQINNFQQRLERLHGAGQDGGFDNGLSVSYDQYCPEIVGAIPGRRCDRQSAGDAGGTGASSTAGQNSARAGDGNNAYGIWTAGMIRSGNHDGRNGSAGVDFETDGVSFGIDYRVNDDVAIGGGVGYGRDDSDIGDNGSRSEGDAVTLALYGSYSPGEVFFLDGLWGYQKLDYDLRRFVTSNGNFVNGNRSGTQWFGSVSAGADIQKGAWQFTPYVRADVARGRLNRYTETGDPIFALTYNSLEVDTDTGNVGVRIDYRREASWGLWSPQFRVEYQHDFKGNGAQTIRYADLPTGQLYRADLNDFDRSRLMLGLGLLFNFDNDWSFKLDYRGLIGSGDDTDHGFQFNVDRKF